MNEPPNAITYTTFQRDTESKVLERNKKIILGQEATRQTVEIAKQVGAWTNLFKGNRSATNGMTLPYIPLQIANDQTVVQLEAEEVKSEEEKWSCALIDYIIGETLGNNAMSRYISQNWLNIKSPDVYLYEEGYYMIRFKLITDMHTVSYVAGPYTISNRPIILKP